jgi:hypothetical protein
MNDCYTCEHLSEQHQKGFKTTVPKQQQQQQQRRINNNNSIDENLSF